MAKNKKGGTTKRRKSRKKAAPTKRRRSRRGGGGGKRGVQTPTAEVLYYAGAMIAGDVIAEALLVKDDGDSVIPDMVSPRAVGLWAYGYWYRNAQVQQFAYALELVHLAESGETDYVAELTEKVADIRGSSPALSTGEADMEDEDEDDEEEIEIG